MIEGHDIHTGRALGYEPGHFIKYIKGPAEGYGRAQSHQGIHIGTPVEKGLKAGIEEGMVHCHNNKGQNHFRQGKAQMVMIQKERHRQIQHIVSHGEVHEDYQEKDRNEKPSFELRRFMVLQGFLFRFQPGHTGRGSIHGFGTIACLFHRLHHIAGRSLPFYGHGIGQKRHCHFVYSRHPAHRFFHVSLAGSAGHAGHHVLAFIFTHKITIFLLRIKTKENLISSLSAACCRVHPLCLPFLPGCLL